MFRILPQITYQTPFNSDYFSIYYMLYKKSCGIFIEFSIVHTIGYNNAI